MLPMPAGVRPDPVAHGGEMAFIQTPLSTIMPLDILDTASRLTIEGPGTSIMRGEGGVVVVALSVTKVRCC